MVKRTLWRSEGSSKKIFVKTKIVGMANLETPVLEFLEYLDPSGL